MIEPAKQIAVGKVTRWFCWPEIIRIQPVLVFEQRVSRDGLSGDFLNKTLPEYLLSAEGARAADTLAAEAGPIAEELVATGVAELADTARTARVLRTIGESFQNFAVVATREAELKTELGRVPEVVANV